MIMYVCITHIAFYHSKLLNLYGKLRITHVWLCNLQYTLHLINSQLSEFAIHYSSLKFTLCFIIHYIAFHHMHRYNDTSQCNPSHFAVHSVHYIVLHILTILIYTSASNIITLHTGHDVESSGYSE